MFSDLVASIEKNHSRRNVGVHVAFLCLRTRHACVASQADELRSEDIDDQERSTKKESSSMEFSKNSRGVKGMLKNQVKNEEEIERG